jgi:F-type H+-transporting ATPase subunit delta
MTLSAVATRYANALADVVTAGASAVPPAVAVAELQSFAAALEASAELRNALGTPAVPAGRKRAVIAQIAGILKLSAITRNFLFILVDHRRIAALPEIVRSFELIVDERLGFARAEVSSARELSEAQQRAVSSELERLTGKRLRARYALDETLLGGLVARIGSTVYDGSLRGQLRSLEHRLGGQG